MSSHGNNFASSSSSGYLDEQNNDLHFRGYPFDMANNESSASTSQTIGFGLDAPITDLSTASTDNWWVGSLPNGDPGQHSGSTILNVSWSGLADPENFQTRPTPGDNVFEHNESLSAQNSSGQSPHLTFEDKGKARAMDHVPPLTYPIENNNTTAWEDQRPHTPQHHCTSSIPYTSSGVLNTDLSTAVASSSGPQRSNRGATRKGKEIGKNIGRRKRPPKTLPPDINWYRTCDRFYWEMIQTYLLQPSGGLPTPEAAYAKISQSIKEDLHQSPLMVRELGVRPIREQEQYLTSILDVLYPACEGKKRDVQGLLDQVANEIERGLFMVNDAAALRDGSSREAKPEDLNDSAKGVQHRKVEKERRDASHETLRRMSFFFRAPPKSLSRNKVLFFAITYLIFGVEAFGDDGFVIALPKL